MKNKKVLLTGHTGQGSWLTLLLHSFGAKVTGYAITYPFFDDLKLGKYLQQDTRENICNLKKLKKIIQKKFSNFHSRTICVKSYADPLDTVNTNVNGTKFIGSFRSCKSIRSIVLITSDKVI